MNDDGENTTASLLLFFMLKLLCRQNAARVALLLARDDHVRQRRPPAEAPRGVLSCGGHGGDPLQKLARHHNALVTERERSGRVACASCRLAVATDRDRMAAVVVGAIDQDAANAAVAHLAAGWRFPPPSRWGSYDAGTGRAVSGFPRGYISPNFKVLTSNIPAREHRTPTHGRRERY